MVERRRRQWHPTPELLPGKSHGRRSLVGCSPWGRWGSDMTAQLHFHFSLSRTGEGNGNPLQCSCLESPRDGGAWWAAVYGVAQSQTGLKWRSSSSSSSSMVQRNLLKTILENNIKIIHIYVCVYVCVCAQSRLTPCDPKDCSPPGSSVRGMLQARKLAWVSNSFSRWSSQPRDGTQVSCNAGRFFTLWATNEALNKSINIKKNTSADCYIVQMLQGSLIILSP